MTVADLIKQLSLIPPDAVVVRQGDEYKDDERFITLVQYRKDPQLGMLCANSVILR